MESAIMRFPRKRYENPQVRSVQDVWLISQFSQRVAVCLLREMKFVGAEAGPDGVICADKFEELNSRTKNVNMLSSIRT
ncbi:hypothetical protein GWI33_021840 [Rhynchophorus ferrugineus]|uniref:Uncharacterized protein n=1 Tax=Rhynchophorus ferrugineus TaxID=354439 RepID=A0A834MMV2_RHYFE|nr:hypothetical protein GWI33_021840 [Rhynchophorus ferrugineus]